MTRLSTEENSATQVLELSLLQLLRLKGRVKTEDVPGSLDCDGETCAELLETIEQAGLCSRSGPAARLTAEGRQRLAELLDAEREAVNSERLDALYAEFDEQNTAFKAIIAAWQMRGDDQPNDHSDPEYDAGVLARLKDLHEGFADLLGRIVAEVPRLAHYPVRFANALERLMAGEHQYVARPILDSYHTVWFELHEELIKLLGRSREEEAAAGRAV